MRTSSVLLAGIILATALFGGCAMFSHEPTIRFSHDAPLVSTDLTPYAEKRAAILAFRPPVHEKGVGNFYSAALFNEFLKAAPFSHINYYPEKEWFGLQSTTTEELATAAAIGQEMGVDVVVLGKVDRFQYSHNSTSQLTVTTWVIDALSGEMIYAQRLITNGKSGYVPPYWNANLVKSLPAENLFIASSNEFVRRLVRDLGGETEGDVDEDDWWDSY